MATIEKSIAEWKSKNRTMGCVSATAWFCKRHPSFKAKRLTFYTKDGDVFQHVVAFDGMVEVDLSPYNRCPDEE